MACGVWRVACGVWRVACGVALLGVNIITRGAERCHCAVRCGAVRCGDRGGDYSDELR